MKHDDQTADRNSPEVEKREEDLFFFSPTIKESVRSPAKLRAIVVNRNRFGFLVRKFTPFQESIRGFERDKDRFLDSPFRKRRPPLESAENTLRSQDLRSGGGLRKLRLPSLSCGFERREKEEGQRPLDLPLLPRSNGGGNGSLRYRCRGDRCETGNPKVRGISEFRMLGF